MRIDVITTFPEMFDSVMGSSMMKRAQEKGLLDFYAHDLRNWTSDKHRTTDDDPYGGGPGLVMMCEPIFDALEDILCIDQGTLCGQPAKDALEACNASSNGGVANSSDAINSADTSDISCAGDTQIKSTRVIMLSPHGRVFNDSLATELSLCERLVFVCGHYEGIDERAYSAADEIISIGDYVLTSGELSSMVVIDAAVRKIDGVLGADGGALEESFTDGLLEYPQYTRPASFRGMDVPEVLLSGDHQKIDTWRHEQQIARTRALRPDLFEELG